MRKLSKEAIEGQAKFIAENPQRMATLEGVIHTMIGGGYLASYAMSRPKDFEYIDSRMGRLPYPKAAICQAVSILALARQYAGIPEPYDLSVKIPDLGIF